MKTVKTLIGILRFILMRNRMLIVSGVSGKLNSSDALNDVISGLESMEDELAEMNMMELTLMFIVILLSCLAALALFAIRALGVPVMIMVATILPGAALYSKTGGALLRTENIRGTASTFL
jgi:hypothetical protein